MRARGRGGGLPLLSAALWKYSRYAFAHQPETALALRAESVAAARRMYALEPGRGGLLLTALTHHRELLVLMDRQEELRAVEDEITRVAAGER
ncbi:hypothetical protein ACFC1D_08385 [Streptomyces vinaceus]|uniref:hypothetical protein n=1 Tax=Streptomyces vinaceus TaxID=1960 RepID=UPI0035D88024